MAFDDQLSARPLLGRVVDQILLGAVRANVALQRELAGNAWYLATLLVGEMPDDIEDVFAGVGLSLFDLIRATLRTNHWVRGADGKVALPTCSVREREAREIGARDQQQRRNCAQNRD